MQFTQLIEKLVIVPYGYSVFIFNHSRQYIFT